MKPLVIVEAPCNLGLRAPRPGQEPGTWRAPAALRKAGLHQRLGSPEVASIARPSYSPDPQQGTQLLNGPAIRDFNLELAAVVEDKLREEAFPLVIGGDCSILLGCLLGARRLQKQKIALVHLDGHADFFHPGNHDPGSRLGTVAGMDLAIATGRGEPLLTEWPEVGAPLVSDRLVIQVGDREGRGADSPWPDIGNTKIVSFDIFKVKEQGVEAVAEEVARACAAAGAFWLHIDLDVLDQSVMPAVDCPGSPGLTFEELEHLVRVLTARPECMGANLTIFDPDLDLDGRYAQQIVTAISGGLLYAGPSVRTSHR